MNIMVFDTETANKVKKFCYNIGWVILDTDTSAHLVERDFVVEQIWHNNELFSTAYYAEKRPIYVKAMRARKTVMSKWGYIMQTMIRDIKRYNIVCAYAYNSPFDDEVVTFNCDWFKTQNPFDTVPIYDLLGLSTNFITSTKEYKDFCETHELFTESGNYSTTAENVFRYLISDPTFVEDHTALSDARIETQILSSCIIRGAQYDTGYSVVFPKRIIEKPFTIKVDNTIVYSGQYIKKYNRNDVYKFTTKDG